MNYLWSGESCYSTVVTRYMGSGIRVPGSGSKTQDPGSQVMGSGSAIFCVSLRDQGSSFSDTSLLMRNKNTSFCKEKDLLSGLLKKLKPGFIIF